MAWELFNSAQPLFAHLQKGTAVASLNWYLLPTLPPLPPSPGSDYLTLIILSFLNGVPSSSPPVLDTVSDSGPVTPQLKPSQPFPHQLLEKESKDLALWYVAPTHLSASPLPLPLPLPRFLLPYAYLDPGHLSQCSSLRRHTRTI